MNQSVTAVLRHYGESTAYSSKGHFRSADFQRIWNICLLFINLTLSIVTLAEVLPQAFWLKLLSASALLASISLLVTDSVCARTAFSAHHKFGNAYLALHYDISRAFHLQGDRCPARIVKEFQSRLVSLNNNPERPPVTRIGRFWSKIAIEYFKEMDLWWKP